MTPSVTLTGKLQTISGADDAGYVVITLINYGCNQPEVSGNSIVSDVTNKVQAAEDGTWSVNLWGNHQIWPKNTLYEIAVYPSSDTDTAAETSVAKYKLDTPGTFDLIDLIPAVTVLPPAAYTPVTSVNGRSGSVVLTAADVYAMPYDTVITGGQGVNADWNATSGAAQILNKPTLAPVAVSGNFNDLANKPTVPTNISAFTNDSGYVTAITAPVRSVAGKQGAVTLVESDITGLVADLTSKQSALGFTPENVANKGVANGYASIDSTGHIPLTQIPAAIQAAIYFAGLWNANTNSPTLTSGVGILGQMYKVSVAGNTTVDGQNNWHLGDWIVYTGASWSKVDNYEAVTAVAGRTGAITLAAGDVSGLASVATSGSYNDLGNKPTIPAGQVNSDWNSVSGLSQILNKPTLAASATMDTTNATNITSGVLPIAQLPAFTSGTAGIVPASGGGSSNYLRADGSWAAPSGGGGGGTWTWAGPSAALDAGTVSTTETPFNVNFQIPANSLAVGTTYMVTAFVQAVAPVSQINRKYNLRVEKSGPVDVTLWAGQNNQPSSNTTRGTGMTFYIRCLSTGSSGTVDVWAAPGYSYGTAFYDGTGIVTQPVTIDTTANQTLQLTVTFASQTAGNADTLRQLGVWKIQ
jgi:hypothetical protein